MQKIFFLLGMILLLSGCNIDVALFRPKAGALPDLGSEEPPPSPITPSGKIQIGGSVQKVVTGFSHTCVILDSGDVKCWGANGDGQLGYDDQVARGSAPGSVSSLAAVNLGAGRTAIDLAAGAYFTCAILDTGDVKCWGDNYSGQLGYNDWVDRGTTAGSMASLSPVFLGVGRTAKSIDAGFDHVCVILDTDDLKCWGTSGDGQLGLDRNDDVGDAANEMQTLGTVNVGVGRKVKYLAAGGLHTCAILDTDDLKCWGYNGSGQLGYDSWDNIGDTAGHMAALGVVNLGAGRKAKKVTVGDEHTCVILDTNEVKCWGDGSYGSTGYDDENYRGGDPGDMAALVPVNLGVGRTAKDIQAAFYHTCVILDNDQVKCFGGNFSGQLGYNDLQEYGTSPGSMAALPTVNLGTGRTAKSLSLGRSYSCAILDTDDLKCWGENTSGKLGQEVSHNFGSVDFDVEDLGVVNLGGATLQVAVGSQHSCAVLVSGDLKCWGFNGSGQLGYDDTVSRGKTAGSMASLSAVFLGAGRTAKKVFIGTNHTCVILDNDQVKCWGANGSGQLGYDSTTSKGNTAGSMAGLGYVNLGAGRTAKSLALGVGQTCAILDNDQMKCWGGNSNGELGYDSTTNKGNTAGSMATLGYVNLGAGRTAKAIAAGALHTCAILDTNGVKCWGYNNFGNLGIDSTANKGNTAGSMATLAEINLGAGRTALSIAAGLHSTCVVLDTFQVKCWGDNSDAQLGYGDTAIRGNVAGSMAALGVVNLGAGVTAKSVRMGWYNTCATLSDDQIKCWGKNTDGQLGYNDTTARGGTAASMTSLGTVKLGEGRSVQNIAVSNHVCAVLDNGDVKCWGKNNEGQAGYDNQTKYGSGKVMEDLLLIGE
ncbi:RCC1 domain-containing protein [Bdellovibrio sp. HCB-110]|uniref:RCC1 domain-containing protein n=1 Tax=Bdellovibrio sp. HCB-110 TaxID=3391182 RepID=UPI0039B4FBEE